ncbi:MAG TPA: 2-oxopent-4-enoate hydratase, partial [Burkholderiaceae bacterium]|nr:2-oxopent-4-enoate hydratase [Burkholderiaceae bacterium]
MAALPGALSAAVHALRRARSEGERAPHSAVCPASRQEAYAIQDATVAGLGPMGGWKVGARARQEPTCAPLPLQG